MRSRKYLQFVILSHFWILIACGPDLPKEIADEKSALPQALDFNTHIKPILSDRCFACHGPDKNNQKAGLRLDIPEKAFAELVQSPGRHAIVPSDIGASEMVNRILTEDAEIMMPPPESNLKLNDREKAILIKWIEDGAEYKPHWAFIKPERPELPESGGEDWAKNEIDPFIYQKLKENDFEPSPEASKATLIRRVSFDLTGLPPSLDELNQFMNDESPDAYEQMVDHYLSKSSFGERMAAHWLDVARYADSHGYQDDGWRNMWPYRDWVISKFNENLPFDKFVKWQIAGDLLPNPSQEQILATAFNRNHTQSQEGGIIAEEYRTEYVADRNLTLGKAFMGLTVECARCHDHKYDPISQKEYYQLFSFFNSVNESGITPYVGEASPTVILTDEIAEEKIAAIKSTIDQQKEKIDEVRDPAKFERWLESNAGKVDVRLSNVVAHYPLDAIKSRQTSKGKEYFVDNITDPSKPGIVAGAPEDQPVAVEALENKGLSWPGKEATYIDLGEDMAFFERHQPFSIGINFQIRKDFKPGPIFARSGGDFNGNRGYEVLIEEDKTLTASLIHTSPDNQITIRTKSPINLDDWYNMVMTYDGSSKASGISLYLNGEKVPADIVVDNLKRSIIDYGPNNEIWDAGYANFRIANKSGYNMKGIAADNLIIFDKELVPLEVYKVAGKKDMLQQATQVAAADLSASSKELLKSYYWSNENQEYKRLFQKLTALRADENDIFSGLPEVMVMKDLPEPRKTYLLERGVYDAPGEEVYPGTPEAIGPFPDSLPKNRLGLAEWLLSKENPLLARVTVNRFWQLVFGKGIVTTSDDFGNQGELPTHPELLDWLAVEFRESGWDVKYMMKKMVMSATYRQSSNFNERLLKEDPYNTLYARGPSYRLPAEMIRDNALAASGLLVNKTGGPSVKPYQPDGLWKELATRNATEYVQDHGDKLYRRSLYTVWKRTSPPPSLVNFDASTRNFCEVKRQSTNTPLQALVLLNDPQFVEAARVLAQQIVIKESKKEERIKLAFKLLTSRNPEPNEIELLVQLLDEELDHYNNDTKSAKELVSVGEYPQEPNAPVHEVAAYTVIASTLMNYDEAIYKR